MVVGNSYMDLTELNSTALLAFTVLLLVVIAILLGVLEGILDIRVVGVNTGERSEKLLGGGKR